MRRTCCILLLSLFGSSLILADNHHDVVKVQLLGINDFHGNLEPPNGSGGMIQGTPAGGIEYLATHIKRLQEHQEFSVVLSAGDLFGASPLLSAWFQDKPTIEAMNILGLSFNAVGNHEFDKGWRSLKKLVEGDCEPHQPCGDDQFKGAQFDMLAANVIVNETNETLFPAYQIRNFGPIKIAFVGVVLEGAEDVITKESIEGISFRDEADSVNALMPELENLGVNTVVVMIHEGGLATGNYNECNGISGPIVNIAQRLNDKVGVILSGHTHQAYNCVINDKIVTSAASNGRLVTEIYMDIDAHNGRLVGAQANNKIVTRDVQRDADQSTLLNKYLEKAAPIINVPVGSIKESLTKAENRAGESLLGRMLADAQLEATTTPHLGQASIALVNPGGIRTDITFYTSKANEGDGNVTYSEAYAVQPFGNVLITMTMTGQEIINVLEQQFAGCGADKDRILQISQGFSYAYRKNGPICHKIDERSVSIEGKTLNPLANYRVSANNFIADGGDGFSEFKKGKEKVTGMSDIDALLNYLKAHPNLPAVHEPRINLID